MDNEFYNKVWQYIRVMKYFSLFDLQILLLLDEYSFKVHKLENYLLSLEKNKIIKQLKNNGYKLENDLGEYPPLVLGSVVVYGINNTSDQINLLTNIAKLNTKTILSLTKEEKSIIDHHTIY